MMSDHAADRVISVDKGDAAFFGALPPEAVRHRLIDRAGDTCHNAIWDMAISPDGRVFFSLCAELAESRYVRLYEYLPQENAFKRHFALEDRLIMQEREIRASKIHTSMSFMDDGRIVMTTHTTAQAPQHPTWMLEGYYQHLWEGFPGSHLLLYDPDTGVLEDRGIPVPRETIYGGTLDRRHNVFYFGGMVRGHVYAYDIDKNTVTDLGQATEFGTYRFCVGPDGHIYSSSRRGRLFRINTDTRQIEELGLHFPLSRHADSLVRDQLNAGHVGPDGRFYLQAVWGDELFVLDTKTPALSSLGGYMPKSVAWPHKSWMVGLHFDTRDVLWYGIFLFNAVGESAGCRLCSWDVLHGGEPTDHGFLSSDLRCVYTLSEVAGRGDTLFVCDGNHLFDRCGMMQIDLAALRRAEARGAERPPCVDVAPYLTFGNGRQLFPGDGFDAAADRYMAYVERAGAHWQFYAKNSESMAAREVRVVCLWETLGFGRPVRALRFLPDGTLSAVCGGEQPLALTVRDGAVVRTAPLPPDVPMTACGASPEHLAEIPADAKLPYVPGRQYLAEASAAVRMADGALLVGTKDGMLCRIRDGRVFSFGAASFNGPVHDLCTDAAGRRAYGVAGHEQDLGMIFSYDEEQGLRWHGRCYVYTEGAPYVSLSSQPVCCALSPDGTWLAVGVADRMSCIYLYRVGP